MDVVSEYSVAIATGDIEMMKDLHSDNFVLDWVYGGVFDYDPNRKFEHLATGQQAQDTFTYTVSDLWSLTGSATVSVTVNGVNDAPNSHRGDDGHRHHHHLGERRRLER